MTGVMTLVHPITNRPANIYAELVWELAFAVGWIVATPLTIWISANYSVSSGRFLKNGIILFGAGMILSTLLCLLHGMLIYLFHPDADKFELNILLTSLFYNIDKMLIVYSGLVVMQHALEFYQMVREQELTASRLETQLSQAQMIALKMQLQPHFLFNTLNAIVTLIHKNAELAEEMIVRLSDFLRLTLESTGKQLIPLREELKFVEAYLAIEEVRFGGRLRYVNNIPDSVLGAAVPALILQPLVENSIKHGFSLFEEAALLTLSAALENGRISLSVSDDAAPFNKVENISEGIGFSNIRSRLAALYSTQASMNIAANTKRGITVTITMPYSSDGA